MKEDGTCGYCSEMQVGKFERGMSLGRHKALDGKIILRCILCKYCVRMSTGCLWFKIEFSCML